MPGLRLLSRRLRADLDLEEPLGERRLDVVHQVFEHLEGLALVLHQWVLLAPRPVLNGVPKLVQVVQVVLPALVEHRQHHLREHLGIHVGDPDRAAEVGQVLDLPAEALLALHPRQLDHLLDRGRCLGVGERVHGHQILERERLPQAAAVPLLRLRGGGHELDDGALERGLDHPPRLGLELLSPLEREQPQRVDHLPLLVHHVVVLQQPLPLLEVLQLNPFLGVLDRPGDQRVGNHLSFFRSGPVHPASDPVGAKESHEVIFEGQEERALPRIALPAGAAAQLPVDAAGLVPLGADDDQPAGWILVAAQRFDLRLRQVGLLQHLAERREFRLDAAHLTLLDAGAQLDVGAPAGHVRRDRDRAGAPCLGHDLRLALVQLGIQDLVLETPALQHTRQRLRHLHAHRAHQNGEPALILADDLVDDGVVLLAAGLVDQVVPVDAADRPVGRDHHDLQPVDLVELGLLRLGRAGHASQLVVHPEVVLDGDGGERLRLLAYRYRFLGFDRLMEAVRPPAPRHDAAGEFIHDEYLAVLDHVLDVLLVQGVGLEQLVNDVKLFALRRILRLDLLAPRDLLLRLEAPVPLEPPDLFRNVGHHE